jgi:hypothetical protein
MSEDSCNPPHPPATAADTTHANASAAKRLRSNGIRGSAAHASPNRTFQELGACVDGKI